MSIEAPSSPEAHASVTYRAPRPLDVRRRGGEVLVFDPERPNWLRTNEVGLRLIDLSDGTRTTEEVVHALASEYGLPLATVRAETAAFLRDAVRCGFLVDTSEGAGSAPPDAAPTRVGGLWLHITRRCNLGCPYCYVDAAPSVPAAGELSAGEIKDVLEDCPFGPGASVIVTGGEPFLRQDLLSVLEVCRAAAPRVMLLTNGTVEPPAPLERIVALTDRIQISFDGTTPEVHDRLRGPGSFERSIRMFERLRDAGCPSLVVSFTPTEENLAELPKLPHFALRLGAGIIHVNRFTQAGRAREGRVRPPGKEAYQEHVRSLFVSFSRLAAWLNGTRDRGKFPLGLDIAGETLRKVAYTEKRTGCGLGTTTMSIDATGRVFPCPTLHVSELEIGDVRRERFGEIYGRSVARFGSVGVETVEKCGGCTLRYFCGGGCRAHAFRARSDLLAPDPDCEAFAAQMEEWCWLISPNGLPAQRQKACPEM